MKQQELEIRAKNEEWSNAGTTGMVQLIAL